MGQASVFYAEVNQEKLASQLDCGTSTISNLNYPDHFGNESLVERIERQLVAWRLIDSKAELNHLREANGVRALDAQRDRELICEVDPDACDPDEVDSTYRSSVDRHTLYVQRPEHNELLNKLRKESSGGSITGVVTAVQGTGGGGKTTLATAVIDELRRDSRRFTGKVRLVFGQKHSPANRISEAIGQLTGAESGPPISDLEEGQRLLREKAIGKTPIVLLDDVWEQEHLGPFLGAFQHCPIVITTRNTKVLRGIGAVTLVLGNYTDAQALEQLSSGLPKGYETKLRALARLLKNWPLAIALANAFVLDCMRSEDTPMSFGEAIDHAISEYERYGFVAYDADGDDPSKSVDASIRLNLTRLKPDEVIAFETLAVFPEDARVPRDVLFRWHRSALGWDAVKVRKFCEHLKLLWLSQGYEGVTNPVVQVHDHIWMYLQGKHKESLVAWQKEFLDAFRPLAIPEDTGEPWPSSPWARLEPANNEYLWRNLEHHLTEAGLQTEWREAVCDWHFISGRAAALGKDLSEITGWDSDLFAKARAADDPDAFVWQVLAHDPLGAAHCAGLPGVRHRIHENTRNQLRGLLENLVCDSPQRKLRDHAIRALFEIGHPDFVVRLHRSGIRYIEPARIHIEHGHYPLGDNDPPFDHPVRFQEMPQEMCPIVAFELGKYTVTNAEMAWFVRAGGYENERWWVGDKARAWRRGIGTEHYLRRSSRSWAEYHRQAGRHERDGLSNPFRDRIENLSVDELTEYLVNNIRDRHYPWPRHFDEFRDGHPSQPVVAVCFYEAQAYCRWLSDLTGRKYSLPNEDQWEAASKGSDGNVFAFAGQFDPAKCNTFESGTERTTPVGAFPDGKTPAGAHDLSGNVREWTASGFDVNPFSDDAFLPSRNVRPQGRDEAEIDWQCRVLRGGSYDDIWIAARTAFRCRLDPTSGTADLGFRVVLLT